MRTVILGVVISAFLASHSSLALAAPNERVDHDVDQAWQLYQRGDCKNAQRILSNTLRIAPQWDPLYFNLGVSAERCGDSTLAAGYYRKYADFDPRSRGWVSERATLLEQFAAKGQAQAGAAQPGKSDSTARKGIPWWLWVVIPVAVLAIAGAVAYGVTSEESEP